MTSSRKYHGAALRLGSRSASTWSTIHDLPRRTTWLPGPGDPLPGGGHIPAGIAPTPLNNYDQTSSIQEQVDPYDYHRLDGISAFDLKHDFVVSYEYVLPADRFLRPNRFTSGWAISGITRFASGLPVTFASSGDNYLVQVQNNGVNAISIDMPNYDGTGYRINHNPRNGRP